MEVVRLCAINKQKIGQLQIGQLWREKDFNKYV